MYDFLSHPLDYQKRAFLLSHRVSCKPCYYHDMSHFVILPPSSRFLPNAVS